jgi:hypothetical protein
MKPRAGDFGIAVRLAVDLARGFDQGVTARSGLVVAERIERVLAGVEARLAAANLAGVVVAVADLVLEVTATQVLVEALIGEDRFLRCFFFLRHWHSSPWLLLRFRATRHRCSPMTCTIPRSASSRLRK